MGSTVSTNSRIELNRAAAYARTNPIKGLPKMAAVLTDGDRYFFGLNSRETHPLQRRFGTHEQSICLHAEVDAIVQATRSGVRDLSSFRLYVARVYGDGTTGLAKPCPGCERAIVAFKIKEVQWTTSSK